MNPTRIVLFHRLPQLAQARVCLRATGATLKLPSWRERIAQSAAAAAGKSSSGRRWAHRRFPRGQARPARALPPQNGESKMVWAVPCDCTTGDRSERALARARVPERYRHCDPDNYRGRTMIIEMRPSRQLRSIGLGAQPGAERNLVIQRFAQDSSARPRNAERARIAADGSVRRGQDASGRRGAEGNCAARAQRTFLRLPRAAEGNSG